jgi:hypothetical protein
MNIYIKYKFNPTEAVLLFNMFLHYNILFQQIWIPVGIILKDTFKSKITQSEWRYFA